MSVRASNQGQNHGRTMKLGDRAGHDTFHKADGIEKATSKDGVSESGRYECETCGRFFCIDCDVFAHEVVHNCPGCQSREGILLQEMQED